MAVLPEKECAACGAFFTPRRNTQVYCEQCREATGGKGCRMKIRYDRASESVSRRFASLDMVSVTFICRQCGEEFLNKGHKKTFCSRGCYLANIQAARATGHTVPCVQEAGEGQLQPYNSKDAEESSRSVVQRMPPEGH